MSFFKKLFSSNAKDSGKTGKKPGAIIRKDLNPEHQEIVKLYTQKNPTPLTSKEIVESIAEELGKKPGGVRSILSKAGVYIKQEKLTWRNNKELLLKEIASYGCRDFEGLSDELRNDKEVAYMHVAEWSYNYKYLPNKFKYDKEFLMGTIDRLVTEKKEGEIILYLFGRNSDDYENDDFTLAHFKDDKEVLLKAWNSQNPKTRTLGDLTDLSIDKQGGTILQRDKEFMLEAVKEDPMNYLYVGRDLKNDSSLLDLVGADDFSDYCDRIYDGLLKEKYPDDDDDDGEDNEDEVIEIP